MTIRPYALTTNQSALFHDTENALSALAKNDEENSSQKSSYEASKVEQIAHNILEINQNKNINKELKFLTIHPIIESLNDKSDTEKEFFIQAMSCNAEDANACYKLANLLEDNEKVELLNGETYTNKDLYLKAIQLNPQDENSYNNLANLLENDETVELLNGEIYTQKELYLKAIQLNPNDEDFYDHLAGILENDETVELLNGEIYTQKELYLKAIQLNPNDEDFYDHLAGILENDETVELLNGEIYTQKELYLKAIDLNPQYENSYYNLAGILENEETVELLSGEIYTQKELYLKAIDLNPQYENSYYNLAGILENDETVELLSGESYTRKELYVKAIELNPKDEDFYNHLADILENDEIVELLSGESYTRKKLYLEAIELNPHIAHAYNELANCLEQDETAELLSGEIYTKKTLYIKAAQLNPKNENAYYNLATLLQIDEKVKLLSGEIYTKKELYLKAIELNSEAYLPPKYAEAYTSLACCLILEGNETVTFLNEEVYTKKELCIKAIELNPQYTSAYFCLAVCLASSERIELLSGEIYTKKKLYCKVIQLNPKEENAYSNLAIVLEKNETVELLSGEIYTKKDLYLKVAQLNPKKVSVYSDLATLLEEDETVELLSGEIYTKKDLYLKTLNLEPGNSISDQARQYLKDLYIQEIERNPNNIEGYFGLILVIQDDTILLKNGIEVDIKFCFKEALNLAPLSEVSSRFAPSFFSVASHLFNETEFLLPEFSYTFTIKDGLSRAQLLKEGASLTLKNGEVASAKALYQYALPFLSSAYLKCNGDKGVGDYLSLRKHTVLKDGIKFTQLMAYTYAYQNDPAKHILIKIGDALHPEQRILLNGNLYDKRACYEEASSHESIAISLVRQAESLYPHEYLRKQDLFYQALNQAHQCSKNRLEAYTILARILSQYELIGVASKYLYMFGKDLKEHHHNQEHNFSWSTESYYENLDDLTASDTLYFSKKQEFLLTLLKYSPSCEEAYVALATSFQDALIIHEKSYASKEALYLKAIDINPEYSLPYFLLGKELFNQKIETILLLNGITLSCKQLFMRAIQLGTYEGGAYHLAALMMDDKEGILLFDEKTILSRGDLFIRAFELDFTRVIDLKNFISYIKRRQKALT